jgi:tetratricopeptide (TPR) repeat protein
VLSQVARFQTLFGEHEAAVANAQESLRLAEALERDDLRAKNLVTLGTARFYLPDADSKAAIADIQAGLDLANACGEFAQLSRGYVNLASHLQQAGELERSDSVMVAAAELAQRRGHAAGIRFAEGNLIDGDLASGRWDSAERRARAFLEASGEDGHYMDNIALMALGMIELARDRTDAALQHADQAVAVGRRIRDPQALVPVLAIGAFVHAELGKAESAKALLDELEQGSYIVSVTVACFAAARLGLAEEFRVSTGSFRRGTAWDLASDAVLDARWADAAQAYAEIGAEPFAALADLRAAESHTLARSLQFWRSVGATRFVREAEALLAKSA